MKSRRLVITTISINLAVLFKAIAAVAQTTTSTAVATTVASPATTAISVPAISKTAALLSGGTIFATLAIVAGIIYLVYKLSAKGIAAAQATNRSVVTIDAGGSQIDHVAFDPSKVTPAHIKGASHLKTTNNGEYELAGDGIDSKDITWSILALPSKAATLLTTGGKKVTVEAKAAGDFTLTASVTGLAVQPKNVLIVEDPEKKPSTPTESFGVPIGRWGTLVLAMFALGTALALVILDRFNGAVVAVVSAALGIGAVATATPPAPK